MLKYNNGKMPSLNQIESGLQMEAKAQIKKAMGDVENQKSVLEA